MSSSTIYPPLRIYKRIQDKVEAFEEHKDEYQNCSISELIALQEAIFDYNVAPRMLAEQGISINSRRGRELKKRLFHEVYDMTIVSLIMANGRKVNKLIYLVRSSMRY